jgi:hypothetical protein
MERLLSGSSSSSSLALNDIPIDEDEGDDDDDFDFEEEVCASSRYRFYYAHSSYLMLNIFSVCILAMLQQCAGMCALVEIQLLSPVLVSSELLLSMRNDLDDLFALSNSISRCMCSQNLTFRRTLHGLRFKIPFFQPGPVWNRRRNWQSW